jgi:hypothetical protein
MYRNVLFLTLPNIGKINSTPDCCLPFVAFDKKKDAVLINSGGTPCLEPLF